MEKRESRIHRQKKDGTGRTFGRFLFVFGIILIAAAAVLLAGWLYQGYQAEAYCEKVLKSLIPLIPDGTGGGQTKPEEEWEVVEVEGVSCAGVLEIPSRGESWPVAGAYEKDGRLPGFQAPEKESDEEEGFIIEDSRTGILSAAISPEDVGQQICFTDVEGRQYIWEITAFSEGENQAGKEGDLTLQIKSRFTGRTWNVLCES